MSEGLAERPIPLLTAQEILQLPDTDIIGFHRHLPPFRLTRMDWRTQPILEKRRTLPASQLPQLPCLADLPLPNRQGLTQALIDPDLIHNERERAADHVQ
jgi:type IV secretory pathway TraG/TraD family ATPase VirD4